MDKSQLPKMIKKLHLFLLLLCSFIGLGSYAQTFPIRITTQLTQPSPIYLSNYADGSTVNSPIKIQLVLNDLTISNRQVRLKIYFQGNGIAFNTNDFVVGAKPLYLEGGFPLQLTNVDLAPYFEYQNLLGLTPNQYAQPLPEGVYNIYVEVYDFATNRKLSSKTGSTTIIFQNEPPFLNLPLNNASIMQQNIQNIVFGWTPRSINVSNVEYEFSLVEIWDKYTPIQNAFAYSPPLYTTTTRTTSLQYGINEPQLIPGKKYAWRVKAKAMLGAEEIGVFKNNGYSEVFSFDYEVFCTAPLAINTEGISENQAKITWTGSIDNFDYQVKYREKNADSEWYDVVTPRENITISNLKPNTTYEYTVGSSCDVGKYTHSTVREFTTLVRDEIAFQGCGIKPDPNDLANQKPLPELFPNDVIAAGDFPIVVMHATGSNGTFSGDGYVTLPFLEKFRKLIDAADAVGGDKVNIGQFSRIRITFNNIGLNTDFKLISGEIIAAYDPNWGSMIDGDKVLTDVLGSDGKPVQGKVDFEVKSTSLNEDGSITITGVDGQSAVIPKSSYNQVYTDSKGNTINIPANGKGEPILSTPAEGGKALASNTNGVSSSGEITQISSPDVTITFVDISNNKYAFDPKPASGSKKLLDSYETLSTQSGETYPVNFKAVSDLNGSDKIVANAKFKNGKTKNDIVFKTNTGAAVESKWTSETQAEITLTKKLDFAKQSILATVKGAQEKNKADSTKTVEGKSDIAGKINVWDLTKKPVINITLLSVNKASTPSAAETKKFLNDVYNKVGITFDVDLQSVQIASLPNEVECGDSDLLNVYTGGQNNIISQIESNPDFKYNEKTYYILYTGKMGQNGYNGFMPLGGQYAFIFDNGNLKTAAHELGHGIFGLKHPFSTEAESGKTNLLVDYGNGTVLSHNDWDIIHSGGWKFYGFQKSSSGAATSLVFKSEINFASFQNAITFEFADENLTGINEFYYRGYKITFLQKESKIIYNKETKLFTVNESGTNRDLIVLLDKGTNLNPELFYSDNLKKTPDNGGYKTSDLKDNKAYYDKNLYEIKKYEGVLPVAEQTKLKAKLKNLDTAQANKIIELIKSLPLNEVLEICPSESECYDIFGKEYSSAEWDKIIKLLEEKKNNLSGSLTRLAIKDQLVAIKNLLNGEQNLDKICRLILSNVKSANKSLEYPNTFKIEYLGNSLGTESFRIELLDNFRIENVEKTFLLTCAANQDITNNDNIEFQISLSTSEEKLTTKLRKGTSAAEALSNLIGKSVLVASIALPSIYVAAEYYLSAEAYTLSLEYLGSQNKKCLESLCFDIGLQVVINNLVKDYNGVGVPPSYMSPLVSCASAYFSNIGWKEACSYGAIVSLGDTVLRNIREGNTKPLEPTIEEAAIACTAGALLHQIVSGVYVNAVKESIQWYYIKNLLTKAFDNSKKAIIVRYITASEKFISRELLATIINNSKDDVSIITQKLDDYKSLGNSVVKQGDNIVVIDANNEIIAKFENGAWKNIEGLVSKLNNKLFSSLKKEINELDKILNAEFFDDFANASDDVLKKIQDENLLDVWKNNIRSTDINELIAFKSKGTLRDQYISIVENLKNERSILLSQNKSKEEVAKILNQRRRDIGVQFKDATPDDLREWIYKFNIKRYTDKLGPTFDYLFKGHKAKGLTDEQAFDKIMETSASPLGNKQALGAAMRKTFADEEENLTLLNIILKKYRM